MRTRICWICKRRKPLKKLLGVNLNTLTIFGVKTNSIALKGFLGSTVLCGKKKRAGEIKNLTMRTKTCVLCDRRRPLKKLTYTPKLKRPLCIEPGECILEHDRKEERSRMRMYLHNKYYSMCILRFGWFKNV